MIAQPVRQLDFLGLEKRHRELSEEGDPLEVLARVIPWESFRRGLNSALGRDKITTGRPPMDVVKMLKVLVLQHLYNLSDFQTSYQLRDRLSWHRFVGIEIGDVVPDEKTIWVFRERLIAVDAIEETFYWFNRHLRDQGFSAKGGTLVDATIIEAPIRRATDAGTSTQQQAQRDGDARWTKKNNQSFYGYKNHVAVDAAHKLVQCYDVTAASTHDSQCAELLLDTPNESPEVYGDSAYRSLDSEVLCMVIKKVSKIHYKGSRAHPLPAELERRNKLRSKIRVRVEHVFAAQKQHQQMKIIRTLGLARARAKIGLSNLVYNMKRFVFLLTYSPPQRVEMAG